MRNRFVVPALVGGAVGAAAVTVPHALAIARIPFFALDEALLAWTWFLAAAIACWVVFSIAWEFAASDATAAIRSESKASRAVHVAMSNVALLLIVAPINGFGRAMPVMPAVMAFGLFAEVTGLCLAMSARRYLGGNWSGEITIKEHHQLVRSGPYARLRHPIYTGLLTMYAGAAIVTGERLALAGLALAFFAYWRKIRLEEASLASAFGAQYDEYRRASWALIPGVY